MKKPLLIAICVVALFIPSYIGVAYFMNASANPVSEKAVSSIRLVDTEGTEYNFDRGSAASESVGESMISFLSKLNGASKRASELPLDPEKYFKVVFTSHGKEHEYHYYFSDDPAYAYFSDDGGKLYKIPAEYAERFLESEYAVGLYSHAKAPVLTIGDETVMPSSMSWMYFASSGEYKSVPVSVTSDIVTRSVSGNLGLSFTTEPDYLLVTMTDSSGKVVFDDVYSKLNDASLFENNTEYDVKLAAKWYEDSGRDNYGEAVYSFKASVTAPAYFYLGDNDIEPGEFVIIAGKNVTDPSKITFSSQPEISFTPVFYTKGDYVYGLVPINMTLNSDTVYKFTVGYGTVTREMSLNVKKKSFGTQVHDISATTVASKRSSTAQKEFSDTVSQYLKANCEKIYWTPGEKIIEPVNRGIRTGYGYNIKLVNGDTYRHEGVNYVVAKNDKVKAVLAGKVIYAGETTMSGRTVIIEHGGGLKSLYAHMSTITVSVGDEIDKGTEIGIVGSTGFTDTLALHFGLYVFDVPVCPYTAWNEGLLVSDRLTK